MAQHAEFMHVSGRGLSALDSRNCRFGTLTRNRTDGASNCLCKLFSKAAFIYTTFYPTGSARGTLLEALNRHGHFPPPVQFLADASSMSHPPENCRTRMTP